MYFFSSLSATGATFAILSVLPQTGAVPTTENSAVSHVKRANIPGHINIGINMNGRDPMTNKGQWTAWVNGEDPCNKHTGLGVYEDAGSPCNHRFSLDGYDYQWSMQGCGGDIWLMRNGVENVGDCYWAPGLTGCKAGAGYDGRWQCNVNVADP